MSRKCICVATPKAVISIIVSVENIRPLIQIITAFLPLHQNDSGALCIYCILVRSPRPAPPPYHAPAVQLSVRYIWGAGRAGRSAERSQPSHEGRRVAARPGPRLPGRRHPAAGQPGCGGHSSHQVNFTLSSSETSTNVYYRCD